MDELNLITFSPIILHKNGRWTLFPLSVFFVIESTLDKTIFRGPQKKFVISRVRYIAGMSKAIAKVAEPRTSQNVALGK